MPISVTNAMPTSFKVELLTGTHNFTNSTGDVFKIALIKAAADGAGTYGAATTNYSDLGVDELATGSGYTRDDKVVTAVTPSADGTTAIVDFSDATWTAATFSTSGALIYNSSKANRAVAVLSFDGDQVVSSGDFTVQMPAAAAATAIVRVA